ncbi:proteasomal ubiquitin receptor ADRM1 homolog isoform X1 [Venturia canescens]|uniref:proteasomal ubiquitin receptor ADRM1 homolog isoform X1 n=1 Tax=Venturia canescens TaxID=32260 RepID=UPI001C9CC028|nr:proteasomal ubiquitin receptor ADRM1 homolog isoform X1 [Venturia canescens]
MSGGALFSNNASRGSSKYLVEFKAGKMTMKGKMVYPDTRKGQVYVYQSDDSLMHFCWKDRTTGVVEDDLIIFPDDCEFKHVPQCETGRVYLLRFKSSSRRFFFWLQDLKTDKDKEHCRKINEVLNNPPTPGSQRSGGANHEGDLQNLLNNMSQQQLMQLFGGVGQIGGLGSLLGTMNRPHGTRATTTTASTPVTTSVARPPAAQTPAPTTVTEAPKPADLTTYQDLPNWEPVAQRGVASELTNSFPGAITATESLERTMSEHLPPGDNLSTTLTSPQFSQALSIFWSALQSGQASAIVRQFGLGPEAVNAADRGNLEAFVSALETEVKAGQQQQQSASTTTQQQQQQSKETTGEDDKSKKSSASSGAPSSGTNPAKKDDDDEGMALD